ncbi:unnamed protein product, partial [Allacma fusca]
DILALQMKRAKPSNVDEFGKYLRLPTVSTLPENSVLLWWKKHEDDFPLLASMARDFLAVSGTGVPIERAFSFASDLIQPKQMSIE